MKISGRLKPNRKLSITEDESNSKLDFSILVSWYGETRVLQDWLSCVLKSGLKPKEIIVLDQNRGARNKFQHKLLEYVEFPRMTEFASLDHATSIDLALKTRVFRGNYLLITETDMVPLLYFNDELLIRLNKFDYWLAGNPGSDKESHPCFILIKKELISSISLSDGLGTTKDLSKSDTGRQVFSQLSCCFNGSLLKPTRLLKGVLGVLYKDIGFWHVTSMSLRMLSIENSKKRELYGYALRQQMISLLKNFEFRPNGRVGLYMVLFNLLVRAMVSCNSRSSNPKIEN